MLKKLLIGIFLGMTLSSCTLVEEDLTENINTVVVEKNILALGDSLTAGYNLDLSDGYPAQLEALLQENNYKYRVTNAGVSGDTSKNLLDRIELYDDLKVDIYLLTIGANDGLRRQSVEDMRTNISAIIEYIGMNNPDARIVLSGMEMPINVGLNYSNKFNKSYELLANKYDLALYDFFLEDVAKKTELNLSDGIHPNKKGYKIISGNLYNFLKKENIITK